MGIYREGGVRSGIYIPFNREIFQAILFFILVFLYFRESLKLPSPFRGAEPGPAFYPYCLSGLMLLCCILLAIQGFRKGFTNGFQVSYPLFKKPFLAILVSCIFIPILFRLGYWASSFFYASVIAYIFEFKKGQWLKTLFTALFFGLVISVSVYGLYAFLLGVRLP